jgi:hypothetical protein
MSLMVGGQTVTFSSIAEFEFSLAGRTDVPSRKISDLMLLSTDELKREAQHIKAIEQQFVTVLSREMESPGRVSSFLREIDPHVFSQDHHWRDIMTSLREKDGDYNELRRIALVKYMQYLTSRQEIIKHTYSIKKQGGKKPAPADDDAPETRYAALDGNGQAAMRETVILSSQVIAPEPKQKDVYTRVPKGEAIIVQIDQGQAIDLMLSKHPFRLAVGTDVTLTDEAGNVHRLQEGKNIVGRDAVCNVVVDASLRDVSRLHLIIERLGQGSLRFTDLSSHGTFLPSYLVG